MEEFVSLFDSRLFADDRNDREIGEFHKVTLVS